MQEELTSSLKLTIAKLELKQMEFIDKLSIRHNDYVIRCITCPDTDEILAINGDWEMVTNFKEHDCIGNKFSNFIPEYDKVIKKVKVDGFDSYICDIKNNDGTCTTVNWKSKFFPDINAVVAIGRSKKI